MRLPFPVPNRVVLPAVLGAAVLVACATSTPAVPTATGASPTSASFPADGGPSSTPEAGASASAAPAASSALPGSDGDRPDLAGLKVAVEPMVTGLEQPIFVTAANDGTGRLFVAQQNGVIRIVRDGTLLPTPFVDLSDRVRNDGEQGLLGLALPPGFGPERPLVYVHYSDANGDTTVSELHVSADDPDVADASSERVLLHEPQPYPNHNGGWIGFDQDGMLLIALGDGGSGGDPENRASNLGTILGKMLRIDVLGAAAGEAYAIPADNPFVTRPGARPEILHFGLRNPFRSSVDMQTGNLWIGDVGQDQWEEVDVAPAGARGLDFGWRRWEGRHCFNPPTGCDPAGVTMPVTEYTHADGCSVIGGVVYRGDTIPALRGAYLLTDFCSGTLWAIDAGMGTAQVPIVLSETGRAISSIGIDDTGEVVMTDLGSGELLRLEAEH